jgi:hypothetical protein
MARSAAAICRAHGWNQHSVIGHAEWQPGKVDPLGPGKNAAAMMRDLRGRIGTDLVARPVPERRLRTAPRAIKRAISKHRAKGQVNRRTYKATLEIALIDTR